MGLGDVWRVIGVIKPMQYVLNIFSDSTSQIQQFTVFGVSAVHLAEGKDQFGPRSSTVVTMLSF